jgi:type VI protein secretion system component Hcp
LAQTHYIYNNCFISLTFLLTTKREKMKKIFYFIIAMICIASANAQTVGIGTSAPDTNSVVDIKSTNKGFLMPRVNDTANVAHPSEGMMIYNKNKKAPFFHNGNEWLSLGARMPTPQQVEGASITYTIASPAGFNGIEMPVLSTQVSVSINVNQSQGTNVSAPSFGEFAFAKILDANSMSFQLATMQGTVCPSIEFKFYVGGSAIPYLSYRFKNVYISSYAVSSGGDTPTESISINYKNYGYKDWINNVFFGYDVATHAITAY